MQTPLDIIKNTMLSDLMFSNEFEKITRIYEKIDSINSYSMDFFGDNDYIVYSHPLKCINFTCAEGGFLHVISWLYVIYIDNKKSQENINFLINQKHLYPPSNGFDFKKHKRLVKRIRTFLHHDTKERTKDNIAIENSTQIWFQEHCSFVLPHNNTEWSTSLSKLLDEALLFFNIILAMITNISSDPHKNVIISQWEISITPFSLYDVTQIVRDIAEKKGFKLESHEFCKKNYNSWMRDLKIHQSQSKEKLIQIIYKSLDDISL